MSEIISDNEEVNNSNLSKESEPGKKIVWMVEDNASYAQAALSAGTIFEKELSFTHFQTGEAAENKFQNLIEQNDRLPDVVLMDYQLDQGVKNPKYRTGDEVIKSFQRLAEDSNLTMPEIIAISGDSKFSEILLKAGAARCVDKLKMLALFKELAGQE